MSLGRDFGYGKTILLVHVSDSFNVAFEFSKHFFKTDCLWSFSYTTIKTVKKASFQLHFFKITCIMGILRFYQKKCLGGLGRESKTDKTNKDGCLCLYGRG
jgi:hypothetical protein